MLINLIQNVIGDRDGAAGGGRVLKWLLLVFMRISAEQAKPPACDKKKHLFSWEDHE